MGSQFWRRANLDSCTDMMLEVMRRLVAAKKSGNPYIYLDDVHGRTLRSLMKRDWLVRSIAPGGIDRTRYAITSRGVKAFKVYSIPSSEYDERRFDNICCRCGKNERGTFSTGTLKPYCDDCLKATNNRKYKLFGYQKKPGLCSACGKRPKHVMASGEVRSYCLECRREKSKSYRKKKYRREYELAKSGQTLLCYRCHKRPRWLTGHTLQDYCYECAQEYKQARKSLNHQRL